jgi:uncharacterized membrane protein YphA (DoxX/SURF4 family)
MICIAGRKGCNRFVTIQNTIVFKVMTEQSVSWRRTTATVAAILLALVFIVSGGWKVLRPFQTGELLEQAQVPAGMGVLGATALGTLELFTAFLLLLPRFRRWGGLLASALLIFFICWVAYFYRVLVGHECNCFPIIKRTVGPGFFIGDAVMLVLAAVAYMWSSRVASFRGPAVAFVGLVVFAGVSLGVNAAERRNVEVPSAVIVDGKPQNLAEGKVFLFFYDPECSHCIAAAKFMSKLNWRDTRVIGIPTHDPQFAKDFMDDTHFHVATSLETAKLRKAFAFVDPPFGVALDSGRVRARFEQAQFNEPSPAPDLKRLGFVE